MTRLNTAPQIEPSPYAHSLLNATEPVLPTPATTQYFADFASTYFHPRSILPILPPPSVLQGTGAENKTANPSIGHGQSPPFSTYEAGVDLFAQRDADVDVFDEDIRLWIEETDGLQAIQLYISNDDAWSGFASRYVERLRDELGKCCIWVWGMDGSIYGSAKDSQVQATRAQRQTQIINTALTVSTLSDQASIFVPLALPSSLPSDVRLDRRVLWHTSGFLNVAIESALVSTRLKEADDRVPTVQDWQDALSGGGRRPIASLAFDPDFSLGDRDTKMKDADAREDKDVPPEDLGVDLFPKTTSSDGRAGRSLRKKIFTRIEGFRSTSDTTQDLLLADGRVPARADLILERSVSLALHYCC